MIVLLHLLLLLLVVIVLLSVPREILESVSRERVANDSAAVHKGRDLINKESDGERKKKKERKKLKRGEGRREIA